MTRSKSVTPSVLPNVLKILIIDDEIDICYLLSGILKQKNFKPTYVNTLAEAKFLLKTEMPRVIFLDNRLTDGLGMDFISYIKKHAPSIRIIMMTANDMPADRIKAFDEGVDFFIGKPFTKEIIYNIMGQLTAV